MLNTTSASPKAFLTTDIFPSEQPSEELVESWLLPSLGGQPGRHFLDSEYGKPEAVPHSLQVSVLTSNSIPDEEPATTFDFLLRFSNPKVQGISGKFNGELREPGSWNLTSLGESTMCLSLQSSCYDESQAFRNLASGKLHDSSEMWEITPESGSLSENLSLTSVSTWKFQNTPTDLFLQPGFSNRLTVQECHQGIVVAGDCLDSLSLKTREMLDGIREVAVNRSGCLRGLSPPWCPMLENWYSEFLRPGNLRRYLDRFWSYWYPHCVVVHKPSFDPLETPRALLASMAILGACTSPDRNDREVARFWSLYVEEMVFMDLTTCWDPSRSYRNEPGESLTVMLRALQAAFMVSLYQTWEGGIIDVMRIRQQRYGVIVAVARALLSHAKHQSIRGSTPETFEWLEFVRTEQIIRILMYVFLVDNYFVLFHNSPPKMTIRELRMDLASPESSFQAGDAISCFQNLHPWASLPLFGDGLNVYGAIKHIRKDGMASNVFLHLARSGHLNLWILCSAINHLIFNIEPMFGSESQFLALEGALINWQKLWNLHKEYERNSSCTQMSHEEQMLQPWTRPGLMRYAPEWWLLAGQILQRVKSCRGDVEAAEDVSGPGSWRTNVCPSIIQEVDTTDTVEINHFISSCVQSSLNSRLTPNV